MSSSLLPAPSSLLTAKDAKKRINAQDVSFEDMMARYKTQSEEKIADLKRVTENHRGGYSRRRG